MVLVNPEQHVVYLKNKLLKTTLQQEFGLAAREKQ
jgi:hypothetical protein